MFDFNDAEPQRAPVGDLIPDGTFAKVRMNIRPKGVDGASPMDNGLLLSSDKSDVKMLDCEFTVMEGPCAKRKFWQVLSVSGGKVDANGQSIAWNITKTTLRAMIDSNLGLDPKDMSEAAKAKRVIQGFKQFDGITFVARIMVEPAADPKWKDKNRLANVVCSGEDQYGRVMRGEAVEPDPVGMKPRTVKAAPDDLPFKTSGHQAAGPTFGGQSAAAAGGPSWLNG